MELAGEQVVLANRRRDRDAVIGRERDQAAILGHRVYYWTNY